MSGNSGHLVTVENHTTRVAVASTDFGKFYILLSQTFMEFFDEAR